MYKCVDSTSTLYSVNDYCLALNSGNKITPIYCPFCNNKVFLRAKNSTVSTHFLHQKGTSCETTDYSVFFKANGRKKSQAEILSLKLLISFNIYTIYTEITTKFIPTLSYKDFISIFKKKGVIKALSLTTVNINHIPYILINELGHYDNLIFLYTNTSKLTNVPIWNLSSDKNVILTIEETSSGTFIKHPPTYTDFDYLKSTFSTIPLDFIRQIYNPLIQYLVIPPTYDEMILNELLEGV